MSFDVQQQSLNPSDPNARFLGASCLDLLLIEIVPMAERITEELSSMTNETGKMEDDELREATFYRLETLGYRVGQGLGERYIICSGSQSSLLLRVQVD